MFQNRQDFGGNFDRTFLSGSRFDSYHAWGVDKLVWQAFPVGNVFQASSHQAFDRGDRVFRIAVLCQFGLIASFGMTIVEIADD